MTPSKKSLMLDRLKAFSVGIFACVSVYWMTHVVIFHYIDHTDRTFIWLNVLLFLVVSLSPILTEMRQTHIGNAGLARLSGVVQVAGLLARWEERATTLCYMLGLLLFVRHKKLDECAVNS